MCLKLLMYLKKTLFWEMLQQITRTECATKLSLFTQLLSDMVNVVVSELWYRVIPVCDKDSDVGEEVKTVYRKEVLVSDCSNVSFTSVKLLGIAEQLSSPEDLFHFLAVADKFRLCEGASLSNMKMDVEPGRSYKNPLGLWRPLECHMVVETGHQCKC
ncbi:hypothetical protein PR048_030131 [Dryococelus australis]|uniref:Uncharacterized protein n=1 Tax=Dryococelus australis TaxID=614101 RepID=A0ABQ9G8H6_9NEOP|nr:hypothetical protein PR048_030131 [Dryococelus australis]